MLSYGEKWVDQNSQTRVNLIWFQAFIILNPLDSLFQLIFNVWLLFVFEVVGNYWPVLYLDHLEQAFEFYVWHF